MKDNFFRLTAIVLLLHCFAATAKIMGQNNGDGFAFAEPITDPHDLPLTETVLSVPADEPPAEKFYAVVRYQKVEPGMMDEYLKTMNSWQRAMQQRKNKGEMRYWRLFKRTFPSGTDVDYDYISVTAFDTGAAMEAWEKLTTADWVKGQAYEDATRIENSSKVRHLVKRDVFTFHSSLPEGKPGKFLQVVGTEPKPGRRADYEKLLESSVPAMSEAVKAGRITDRAIFSRTFPNDPTLNDFSVVFNYDSLADALSSANLDFAAEYKKAFPKDDYAAFQQRLREVRDTLWTELWERVLGTE